VNFFTELRDEGIGYNTTNFYIGAHRSSQWIKTGSDKENGDQSGI
jgi:hypothetical protein